MLFVLAWKNIWRNPVRSLIVMTAVVLGIWVGVFMFAYVFGIMDQRFEDAIGYEISHLQIHHPEFNKDHRPEFFIKNSNILLDSIRKNEYVTNASGRLFALGMVAAPRMSSGGKFIGIDPVIENEVTQLASLVREGEYLATEDRNKILIGKKLADRLKVKIRSKVVLTFLNVNNELVSAAFRVKGIFKSHNSGLEEANLYLNKKNLNKLLGTEGEAHEIAVLLKNNDHTLPFVEQLRQSQPQLLTRSWNELAPELGLMIDSLDSYMIIFISIIMLALSFGIINTMLMSVLERVREFGMLMSIGMSHWRLFFMVIIETFLIVGLAAPIGLLLARLTVAWLQQEGIDLTAFYEETYASLGFKPIIYPHLETIYYFRILIMVAIAALLSSLYPAYTAFRLEPVEAIRKI